MTASHHIFPIFLYSSSDCLHYQTHPACAPASARHARHPSVRDTRINAGLEATGKQEKPPLNKNRSINQLNSRSKRRRSGGLWCLISSSKSSQPGLFTFGSVTRLAQVPRVSMQGPEVNTDSAYMDRRHIAMFDNCSIPGLAWQHSCAGRRVPRRL